MKEIDEFSLRRIESDRPRSDLLWRGAPVGLRVDGVALERQWQVHPGYLLFLTEDSPFEEGLHIYLLDDRKHVTDSLELTASYAPGLLQQVNTEGDTAVSFSFFGNDRWRLEILAIPRRHPYLPLFSTVKRKSGFLAKGELELRRVR